MSTKKPRARTARREAERDAQKLADARTRLAFLEPGGAPERPIDVTSASQVEPRVESLSCPRCEGRLRVDEHRAGSVHGELLREVIAKCRACGAARTVWMRVRPPLLS